MGEFTHLDKSEGGNLGESSETHAIVKNGAEWNIPGQIKGSGECDAELLDHHTNEGGLSCGGVLEESKCNKT